MDLPAQVNGLEHARLPARPLHLAIGVFDGVHRGHRAVIESAVRAARAEGGVGGVLTFWPHPSALLRPSNPTRLIQGGALKSSMIAGLGVDLVITEAFTAALAEVAAADFLPWLKQRLPQLAALYVGENFRFGQARRGDVAMLSGLARQHGVRVFSAPRVRLGGEAISSTRIRTMLTAGEIEAANAQLGYPYFAEGVVTPGKRLGRSLGFPTLNLVWAPDLEPRHGVYVVRVRGGAAPDSRPAVANYGLRPTVERTGEPRLETHVLGDCPLGEGDTIRVEWLMFLRPEVKFEGVDALCRQIALDRLAAAEYFGG